MEELRENEADYSGEAEPQTERNGKRIDDCRLMIVDL